VDSGGGVTGLTGLTGRCGGFWLVLGVLVDSGGCWRVRVDSGGGLRGLTVFDVSDGSILWVLVNSGGSWRFLVDSGGGLSDGPGGGLLKVLAGFGGFW
jgi:hypothetical protein